MTKEQNKTKFEKKRKNLYKNDGVVYTDGSAAAVLFSIGKKYEVCKKVNEPCPAGCSESLIGEIHGINIALEFISPAALLGGKVDRDVEKTEYG